MQQIYLPGLIELAQEIGRIASYLEGLDQKTAVAKSARTGTKSVMENHATTFRSLGLELCAMKAEQIAADLDTELKVSEYRQHLHDLYGRMCDECNLFQMLCLNTQETRLYAPGEPYFGSDVSTKFPSMAYEIDECTKCLALGRSTASVFHMMRAIEIAIKAVAACLNIPPPTKDAERNWGRILEKIKTEIERRNKSTGWKDADKEFFEESYASLDAVRVAWRNTTMHIERTYTSEEAEHVLGAVRGFMKKLASRADEKGKPKA